MDNKKKQIDLIFSDFCKPFDKKIMYLRSKLPVKSDVPQGTVLGPLMFLLYINDIDENISSMVRLFADDCI